MKGDGGGGVGVGGGGAADWTAEGADWLPRLLCQSLSPQLVLQKAEEIGGGRGLKRNTCARLQHL